MGHAVSATVRPSQKHGFAQLSVLPWVTNGQRPADDVGHKDLGAALELLETNGCGPESNAVEGPRGSEVANDGRKVLSPRIDRSAK